MLYMFIQSEKNYLHRLTIEGEIGMVKIEDLFRNWNYAAFDSDEYKNILKQIDEFIAKKGKE